MEIRLSSNNLPSLVYAVEPEDEATIRERVDSELQRRLGSVLSIRAGHDAKILFLAPHAFDERTRLGLLQSREWSWIHLSSAGTDFFPLSCIPSATLLSRTFRAYNAPVSEYIVREMLRFSEFGLSGSHIGVVGYGNIGRNLVELLQRFDCDVTVLRRRGSDLPSRMGVQFTHDISDLLRCDQVALVLPLTRENVRIIDHEFLDSCKPGMNVINVSRGEHVDAEALVRACNNRTVSACLDVTDPEPLPTNHPLRSCERVRITGHVAWKCRVNVHAFVEDFVENFVRFLRNDPLLGLVQRN